MWWPHRGRTPTYRQVRLILWPQYISFHEEGKAAMSWVLLGPASILQPGHSQGSTRPLLPLRCAHQWAAHLNNVGALGLEPISRQSTAINRNALLIIIITLTCAFLLEGGLIFRGICWRSGGKLFGTLCPWWLHHVEAQASQTAADQLRRAGLRTKWYVYAHTHSHVHRFCCSYHVGQLCHVATFRYLVSKLGGGLTFKLFPSHFDLLLSLFKVDEVLNWTDKCTNFTIQVLRWKMQQRGFFFFTGFLFSH